MAPIDETAVSRSSEISGKAGHETGSALHVAGEMLALATVSEGDPIADMIRTGQHRDALAACARTHHMILGRLCMALLGSQADADEAVQETLLRAHRAMPTYRGDGSVKAWLCGIARHVCAHVLETRRKGREMLELVPTDEVARESFASSRAL